MYCQKNRLLYVGMTLFFESRMREHERYQPWYGFVDRIETVEFPDRYSASKAEDAALAGESPIFNVLGTARNKRGTGLRTTAVPNDPWYLALIVAHDRGESISTAVTRLLSEYVDENAHLLEVAEAA